MNKIEALNVYEWNLLTSTLTSIKKLPTDCNSFSEQPINIISKDGSVITEMVRLFDRDAITHFFQTTLDITFDGVNFIMN